MHSIWSARQPQPQPQSRRSNAFERGICSRGCRVECVARNLEGRHEMQRIILPLKWTVEAHFRDTTAGDHERPHVECLHWALPTSHGEKPSGTPLGRGIHPGNILADGNCVRLRDYRAKKQDAGLKRMGGGGVARQRGPCRVSHWLDR